MIDVYVILAVIVINAVIGFSQEYKAEKAVKALKRMIVPLAKVYRDDELVQIKAKHLVPGDVILVEEGDRIPADARLIEMKNFRTVEASLTGESLPSEKNLKVLPESVTLPDKKNMVWLGTFVAVGRAKAVVVATGAKTEIGKLAESLEQVKPQKSHFREKTDMLAKYLALFASGGAILTFIVGYFFRDIEFVNIILFTIASLVSGIPAGLPAILAVVLAVGSFRMARRNSIIRNKYATETFGIIDTIISDKTGTITANSMTVQKIILSGQGEISVTGTGWEPKGEFVRNGKVIVPLENKHLDKLLRVVSVCNNSKLIKKDGEYGILGDPTEAALAVVAEKSGLKKTTLTEEEKKIDDLPFNPKLKYRASLSVLKEKGGKKEIYVVGAPEAVLKNSTYVLKNGRRSKLTAHDKNRITKEIDGLTNGAMRVLGVGYKEAGNLKELKEEDSQGLIFVGLVGMMDPPREGVKKAIEKAQKAGIRVIMATGDHKNTAIAISQEIGLVSKQESYPLALTGEELEKMSGPEFKKMVNHVSIFARLSPEIKLKIAKTLQSQGKVIAMTGDGVNDAPALKQADIGISMGIIGTDVARESSEMVLADDNFASILGAVEEGRTVFANTRQTSFFLMITSFAEDVAIISTMVLGMPLPLLPTQILWLNLITGGTTDVALATEKTQGDVLNEKPRSRKENILNKELLPFLVYMTLTMLVLTLVVYAYFLPEVDKARTAAFTVLSFTQLFSMINLRSLKHSIFKIGWFSNKFVVGAFVLSMGLLLLAIYWEFLQKIFEFTYLSLFEIGIIFVLSSLVLWVGEGYKFLKKNGVVKG